MSAAPRVREHVDAREAPREGDAFVLEEAVGVRVDMHNGRMLAAAIGLITWLLASSMHAASFIIELTNGREVTASHVWEEGDEIKCYAAQGTAGFPKTLVKRIKPSPIIDDEKVTRTSRPLNAPDAEAFTTGRPSPTHPTRDPGMPQGVASRQASHDAHGSRKTGLGAGDAQAYRAKKLTLTGELDAATNPYLAASGARNPEARKATLDDMRAYSKQIIELSDEVKKKNGGVLPEWWNE